MFDYSNPRGYEGLFERLVVKFRVNLELELFLGHLTEPGLNRMISHCAVCAGSLKCAEFLSAKVGTIDRPPEFCANSKMIMHIASLKGGPEIDQSF